MKKLVLAAAGLVLVQALPAAAANLVVNGTFTSTTGGTAVATVYNGTTYNGTTGQFIPTGKDPSGNSFTTFSNANPAVQVTGWYTYSTSANQGSPFLFLASPGTIFTTGFSDNYDNGYKTLWQGNPSGGGNVAASNAFSPVGGNIMVMDAAFHPAVLDQNISGLVDGQTYTLSFYYAAAQWTLASGNTVNDQIQTTIGNSSFATTSYNLPSQSFSGWMQATDTFTYSGSNNVLSFLATSNTGGLPPTMLLSGVTLTQVANVVPEPSDLAVLVLGGLGFALARRRRRRL